MEERPVQKNNGLTIVELVVLIVCIAAVMVLLVPVRLGPARDEARKVKCASNLRGLAQAMNLYLNKYGGTSLFAVPTESFRGDSWLATLYWTGIVTEPKLFLCPATDDYGDLPAAPPDDLSAADAVPADAISYAGLCKGLAGKHAHRNTRSFDESAISQASAMACDDNEGWQNHDDGMSVVYFDSHVEFKPGDRSETYDLIGAKGSEYECLDSGEE